MKLNNLRAFDKHLKEAAPSHFSSIYLLISTDDFERKEAADSLARALLETPGELNKIVFDAGKIGIRSVLQELNGGSLFAQKRVVFLEKGEELKKEDTALLEEYFSNPQPSLYFVICASAINRSTRFYKQAEKAGVILDIEPEKAWEKEGVLVQKLIDKAVKEGKRLEPNAAVALVRAAGADSALLHQEWEKLLCYIDKNEISVNDVQTLCGSGVNLTIWQLGDALFAREGAKALAAARHLLDQGEPLFSLLRQIRGQFQSRLITATVSQDEAVKRYPYLKGNMLQKQIQQARQYGLEKCRQAILQIDSAELEAKNSSLGAEFIFEKLLFKLI